MLAKITKISIFFILSLLIGVTNLFAGVYGVSQIRSAGAIPIWSNYLVDETLSVNESKTKTIYANKPYNWVSVKLIEGQTYKFTVGSPEWNNSIKQTTAEGYPDSQNPPNPYGPRRFPAYNWMELVGSLYTHQDKYSYTGKSFVIGMGRTWKATKTGFVAAFANDCENCYEDNSRVVTLTIKRVE